MTPLILNTSFQETSAEAKAISGDPFERRAHECGYEDGFQRRRLQLAQ